MVVVFLKKFIFVKKNTKMLINELAKRTGITAHTIRFYEKSGLIKGKRDETIKSNNYFHYDEETVEKLELIIDAKAIGYTINEISELIDAWYSNKFSKDEKLAFLDEKLVSLDQKIKDLKEMKKLISQYKEDVLDDKC
ncbi:transcriptional regulator, MerR family [Pricia antarctica]|uniref:Transcriptional regulator, MerR family n=1 Tax=Pricia antarctica TaxID=641691 RepID=A0A1G7JKF5_9FLAO|nr:MerR family transcriptional regulator [Pricia antarctica]SDF24949.1 transcriptional regulator, MerR family [Pricia antarctica]